VKVLEAKVDWHLGYANSPTLELLVDRIPEDEELIFEKRKQFYMAVLDGYVRFFSWRGPGNDGGFCGSEFPIRVRDGDEVKDVVLKGPWSSRAGVMNRYFEQQVLDVTLYTDPAGHMRYAGAVTLELAQKAVEEILNVELVEIEESSGWYKAADVSFTEVVYRPTYTGEKKGPPDKYGIYKPFK